MLPKQSKQAIESSTNVASQDIDALGFGDGNSVIFSSESNTNSRVNTPSPGLGFSTNLAINNALLTSSALLSDDEYEGIESTNKSNNIGGKSGDRQDGKQNDGVLTNNKSHITLVVAGHVDAGKSTLIGNLMYKVGTVNKRTIQKYEKESQQTGKGSFALAWVMDESDSERAHGVTIDLAERQLKTEHRYVLTLMHDNFHMNYEYIMYVTVC